MGTQNTPVLLGMGEREIESGKATRKHPGTLSYFKGDLVGGVALGAATTSHSGRDPCRSIFTGHSRIKWTGRGGVRVGWLFGPRRVCLDSGSMGRRSLSLASPVLGRFHIRATNVVFSMDAVKLISGIW